MISVKPECDVAIACSGSRINLYFGRLPDSDVVDDIFSLTNNPGLEIIEPCGFSSSTVEMERVRSQYMIGISPVYSPASVSAAIHQNLQEVHGLNVRLLVDDDLPGRAAGGVIGVGAAVLGRAGRLGKSDS